MLQEVDVIITKYKWSTNVLALDISSWRKKYVIIENAITTTSNKGHFLYAGYELYES